MGARPRVDRTSSGEPSHVIEHGKPQKRSTIIKKSAGQIVMSQQKFGSNVVEKCLTYGGPVEPQILVNEMLGSTNENEPLQGQLFQLMQRLESTTPHFIRCIKPNKFQLPATYEQRLVLQQLRCCGVLEVVRISRSGYPTRMSHQKFVRRYGFLLLEHVAIQDLLSVSVVILHQFNILPDMYQVGYTKLFFRTGQVRLTHIETSNMLDEA